MYISNSFLTKLMVNIPREKKSYPSMASTEYPYADPILSRSVINGFVFKKLVIADYQFIKFGGNYIKAA
jgi:hypothetical protein